MSTPRTIAIIGVGNVGGTLGRRFAGAGHRVIFGVREGGAVKGSDPLPSGISTMRPAEAAREADIVLLAVPSKVLTEVLHELGDAAGALDGKIVIDATNPLGPGLRVIVGPDGDSGGERLQAALPRAHVVKAFNTTGFGNMANPVYGDTNSVMFVAGENAGFGLRRREQRDDEA